tara:strand:+ start:98 stop:511 length:414 start_codon:yes stop_codon:yes gene_type:complete
LTDKLSEKDKKDWKNFLDSSEKLEVKDGENQTKTKTNIERVIDLHGHTLKEANIKITEFINKCFNEKVTKINVITGKGLRSKNLDDPYQSTDLSILKYSVPDFIRNNQDLMNKILKIDFDAVRSPLKGSFDIILKKK